MLVSISDLITYMDISLTNRQRDAAEMVLLGLQSELEGYLRRPIEVDEFEEVHIIAGEFRSVPQASFFYDYTLDTTGTTLPYMLTPATVYLRNTPIISVSEVSLRTPEGDAVVQMAERDYIVHRYGIDMYRAMPNDEVTVTYTAGLDGDQIHVFKLMILRAATREMQNMHDDVVGVKDLNPRGVAPMETGFLEKELMAIKRWRRRRIA
jgi:hypothetical protein